MKRSTIAKTFTIAAITALALCIAPTAKADDKGCSTATLKGAFVFTSTGFIVAPAQVAGPLGEVGLQTFDGKGNTNATATISVNGNIIQLTLTGTYTVNPDCTGTFTFQVSPIGITSHLYFVIDQGGNGFQALVTDQGIIETRIGRRQFPVGDLRN